MTTHTASYDPRPENLGELEAILADLDGDGSMRYSYYDGTDDDPDLGGDAVHDNNRRAAFAAAAVIAYARRTHGGRLDNESPEIIIGDLLGDLRHLCDLLGIEMPDDGGHYEYEIAGVF